jgi:succinate dehydrogenase / fumarate reductase flavoprotein subunit
MKEPVPIQPTAHYAMGGLPTDNDGRVRSNAGDGLVTGLFAAGECACVSVHGANRLGTNSLVDLVVFGRRGGKAMAEFCQGAEFAPLPDNAEAEVTRELERIRTNTGKEKAATLRQEMQTMMMDNVSVFRTQELVSEALDKVRELKRRFANVQIDDKGKRFNTDLLETFELGCLLDLAEVTAVSALNRTESRGGHSREDYPNRDDKNWLKHTFATIDQPSGAALTSGPMALTYRPVVITKFEPKERKY